MRNIILVTGGAGFIGTYMIKLLLKKTSFKIFSLDNYSSGSKKNHIQDKRVKYFKGSTLNIKRIFHKKNKQIKTIFHFGEFSRIAQSFKYFSKCFEYNLNGTHCVLEFALKNRIKVVYSATSSMFSNRGLNENLSPYTWTKSKNIQMINNYHKWFNLDFEIVYFFNVYGHGQIKNHEMAAVIGIFEHQFDNNKPLTVVKPGNQKRDFTHIDDIVLGTYLAWKKSKNKEYMIGTNKRYSVKEIAKMFETKIKMIPERPGERFNSLRIKNSTFKDLNFKPKKSIKKYIKDYINRN